MKQHSHSSGMGEPAKQNEQQRLNAWINTVFGRELEALRSLPPDTNINKPGCEFWRAVFALASVVKAYNIPISVLEHDVWCACEHIKSASWKEIKYQCSRAYRRAKPRYWQP